MPYNKVNMKTLSNKLPEGVKATEEIKLDNFYKLPKFWASLGTVIFSIATGNYLGAITSVQGLF